MFGKHLLKGWSSTQKVIALSSGEAEYYGIVRGASEGFGSRSVMRDLNVETRLRLKEDSSAAKGIAQRSGLGKTRHIEVNQLWVQEKVRNKELELCKVKGLDNLADALTKYVDGHDIEKQLNGIGCYIGSGRHSIMPEVTEDFGAAFDANVIDADDDEDNNLGSIELLSLDEEGSEGTAVRKLSPESRSGATQETGTVEIGLTKTVGIEETDIYLSDLDSGSPVVLKPDIQNDTMKETTEDVTGYSMMHEGLSHGCGSHLCWLAQLRSFQRAEFSKSSQVRVETALDTGGGASHGGAEVVEGSDVQVKGYYMNLRGVFNLLVQFAQPRGSANFTGLLGPDCASVIAAFKLVLCCKTG